MPTSITMPQLGESVAEGAVGRWLKREGELVKRDEPLVEIITDKITAELPSPVSGRLARIIVNENETVKIGVEIAQIEEGAAMPSAATPAVAPSAAMTAPAASVAAATPAPAASTPVASNGYSGSAAAAPATPRHATQERVSPLARRLAQEHQLDLDAVAGSGEGGRIRKEDILAHLAQQGQTAATAIAATAIATQPASAPLRPAPAAAIAPSSGADQVVTPSPARRAIAEHMVRSKHTSPHATTLVEVDMTNLARWLDRNKDDFKRREGYGISFQTFAIKATVEALIEHPYLNSSWTADDKIVLRKQINIGVSIALEQSLIVPVIHNADTLNIAGIARAVNDLVTRARTNKLQASDVQGATFTVNNPGVFGTLISMAIINQPNAGILTMDAVEKRPVVIDDAIAIRQMMYMSLSFDHRVIDGLTAARFLGAIKRRLERWGPEIEVY